MPCYYCKKIEIIAAIYPFSERNVCRLVCKAHYNLYGNDNNVAFATEPLIKRKCLINIRKTRAHLGKNICPICAKPLSKEEIGKHAYCRLCKNKSTQENRKVHSLLTLEQRKKANARSYLNVYIRRGAIKKRPCAICGELDTQAHHEDYDKPLDVIWLCKWHHLNYHRGLFKITARMETEITILWDKELINKHLSKTFHESHKWK